MPLHAVPMWLDVPAIVAGEAHWTWRDVHTASMALADALPAGAAVCNLCGSRLGFLITWLAALRAERIMILPPSSGGADVAASLAAHARVVVVVDDDKLAHAHRHAGAHCCVIKPARKIARRSDSELAWVPQYEPTAVILHTSGSTGAPEAQRKSLRQLCAGAQALGARLETKLSSGLAAIKRIVCSVPPQHMFGFELSVMLPLAHGTLVQEGRPLLPADLHDALSAAPNCAWVATPLNLHTAARAALALPNCSAAIVSTMALSAALARQSEVLLQAPVLEIYGSTETGVLALRRTAAETLWRPVAAVRIEHSGEKARAWGEHFASPQVLSDRLEIGADGSFTLLGRHADLIKIGGRRASLGALNLLIHELPGVDDAAFYLPNTGAPAERLCLVYAGRGLDRRALLEWLRQRLDPAFVPRTLIQVERLPRGDNGKLPRAALERIYQDWRRASRHSASRGSTLGQVHKSVAATRFELVVPPNHAALDGHFPGQPIVPGAFLLERVLAELQTLTRRRIVRLARVKFPAPLTPGECAQALIEVEQQHARFRVEVARGDANVLVAGGTALLSEQAHTS